MSQRFTLDARRSVRPTPRSSAAGGASAQAMAGGANSGCAINSGAGLQGPGQGPGGQGVLGGSGQGPGGGGAWSSRITSHGLGPPDIYPQEPAQKEDELTPIHVKQGFTQNYFSQATDEYASLASSSMLGSRLSHLQANVTNISAAKVMSELKAAQSRKDDAAVLPDTGKRKHSLNTKEHFWLVTNRTKDAVDRWFRDLSSSARSLAWLAKRVPVFNKREELLICLSEHDVPMGRAVWFIKMTAAYASAMAETNKTKKRQTSDPSAEWTQTLTRFLKDQLVELNLAATQAATSYNPNPGLGMGADEPKLESRSCYRYWTYVTGLCSVMYNEGLLDRQEFLQWIQDSMEKIRYLDDPAMRFVLPLLLQFSKEFVKSELLSRKMAYNCARKLTSLVSDTDALATPDAAGASTLHPVMAAFGELMEDPYTRFVLFGLSSLIQIVTLECPTALVWNYFGEMKSPSSLLGSPLDFLPNCAPSGLPMPPRQNSQAVRAKLKQAETLIKERSIAVEGKWSGDAEASGSNCVNIVLTILDELDSYVFERIDSSSTSLETMSSRLFGHSQFFGHEELLLHTLCDWAVSSMRSGEYRAFVVAKLLERRQSKLIAETAHAAANSNAEPASSSNVSAAAPGEGSEDQPSSSAAAISNFDAAESFELSTPIFQNHLFEYLDLHAPTVDSKTEFSNLVLLFYELIYHDVFSPDAYMCQLISRGDLEKVCTGGKSEDADGSFEDSKINDDLSNLVSQIQAANQLDGPASPHADQKSPHALNVSKQSRHWQYCYHFPLPPGEASLHDSNQRQILLYGAGAKANDMLKNVKKINKDIQKLFNKKFCIDVSEGGKVKKHSKNDFLFDSVVQKFQALSYFDQHTLTHSCGQIVVEMLSAFANSNSNHLPVAEYVSFLLDLTGMSLNVQGSIELCLQILKELPSVESKLGERGSSLNPTYASTLALIVVSVLRRYHSVVVLRPSDVIFAYEQLNKIVHRPKLSIDDGAPCSGMLECNSAERCVLTYLYDLSCNCAALKTKERFAELKRLFASQMEPSGATFVLTDKKFGLEYIANPKRPIEILVLKHLEDPQVQHNLVCNVLMEVCECNDTDKLNDIAILCCEFTAQHPTLSMEWLGALHALCSNPNPNCYADLLAQVSVTDHAIYNRLGIFVSILIARNCFTLQAFVMNVAIPPLLTVADSKDSEGGARLTCHLLMKLLKTVDSFQPMFYSMGSPHPMPRPSTHSSGIKHSCDRHLLSSAQRNTTVAVLIAVLKAILVLCDQQQPSGTSRSSNSRSSSGGFDKEDFGLGLSGSRMESSSLVEFANHTLKQICSQEWVHTRCLQVPDDLLRKGILLDGMLSPGQAQRLLRLVCHSSAAEDDSDVMQAKVMAHILSGLNEWNLRISIVDIRLMYLQQCSNQALDLSSWLDSAANAIVSTFQLIKDSSAASKKEPVASDAKKQAALTFRRKFPSHCMIPYLVKHLKFLQSRVLKVSGHILEEDMHFGKSNHGHDKASSRYRPFVQLVLTCIRELDNEAKADKKSGEKDDKKASADRAEKEELLHKLLPQLQQFLCFNTNAKIYDYEDPLARKFLLESLQLRFSLTGGLFDLVFKSQALITEWATLLAQFIAKGVVDLANNAELYCTVLDMLATLIHSTLITDRESSKAEHSDDTRKYSAYHNLVKKIKKEIGESASLSLNGVRQLLPLPKIHLDAVVCEPFGTVTDGKGNKGKGLNADKKQGFQVSDKQRINPWDILEGHRNPAPLSWTWFDATKNERHPLPYEESFYELKYASNRLEHPTSYYLDAPPLPVEDVELLQSKDAREAEKTASTASSFDAGVGGMQPGLRMGVPMGAPMGRGMMPMMPMQYAQQQQQMMMQPQPQQAGNMMSMMMMQNRQPNMMMRGPSGAQRMLVPGMAMGSGMGNSMGQQMYPQQQNPQQQGRMAGPGWAGGGGAGGYGVQQQQMMQQQQQQQQQQPFGSGYGQTGPVPVMSMSPNMSGMGSAGRMPYSSPAANMGTAKNKLQSYLRARSQAPIGQQYFGQGGGGAGGQFMPQQQQQQQQQPQQQVRPNFPMQPAAGGAMRMQQAGGFQGQQFAGSSQQFGFSGQMSQDQQQQQQFLMRQQSAASGGSYGGQMVRPAGLMSGGMAGSGGAGGYAGGGAMRSAAGMGGGGQASFMQNNAYRQSMPAQQQQQQQQQGQMGMAMQSQNPQLMAQLQRGQNVGMGQQMGYTQQQQQQQQQQQHRY